MFKVKHWALSRKFLAYIFTSGALIASAIFIKNGNYPQLAISLVAMAGVFIGGNTVAGIWPGGVQPTAPGTTTVTTAAVKTTVVDKDTDAD